MSIFDYFDWITPAKSLVDTKIIRGKITIKGDNATLEDARQRGEKISNISLLPGGRVMFDVEKER